MTPVVLKRIWKQRKSNGWLFVELFIVCIILWYVIDFMITAFYCNVESKGYDTNHVYQISVSKNPVLEKEYDSEQQINLLHEVIKIINDYPGVESTCYYAGTVPYGNRMFQAYTIDSTQSVLTNIRGVSKEYFEVFKVENLNLDIKEWSSDIHPIPAVVSRDLCDELFENTPQIGERFFDYYSPQLKYKLVGIAARTKRNEYHRYEPFIYFPLEHWLMEYIVPIISIRVRPESEVNFIERFTNDMRDRLTIGPYYFSEIKSYNEAREIHDTQTNNYIRTSVAILFFFIFNVFLAIIGTFWFRTKKRKEEIGLRMALGASRSKIFKELLSENICILLIAILPAIIICLHLWYFDLTVNTFMDQTFIRFSIGMGITILLLLIMVITGVWYPAYQAMKIKSAEALHDE